MFYDNVYVQVKNWTKFAKFEEKHGNVTGAREVYTRAVDFFGEEYMEEALFIGRFPRDCIFIRYLGF